MTYESRGAKASHESARENLLLTCRCGQDFETSAGDPADECVKCRRARWKAEETHRERLQKEAAEYRARPYVLEYDASAWPMKKGYRLSQDEVEAGAKLGAFALGTRLTRRGVVWVMTPSGLEER